MNRPSNSRSSNRGRNANVGYVNEGRCRVSPCPCRPPNVGMDISDRGCGNSINWYKVVEVVILIALLMPIVWYIHGHFCTTQTLFNKVEEDIIKMQEQMEQMKQNVEMGTNEQWETIGKDTSQKLADVAQMLQEIKTCTQTDSPACGESDCCSVSNSNGDDGCGLGRPDFALESSGGTIIGTGDTEQFESGASTSIFGIPICCSRNGPLAVIQANVQPGECWAFKGHSGSVTIKLLGYVQLSGVSLEHIPKSISPSGDIDSAPNEFCIVGLVDEADTEGTVYGPFHYNRNGPPVQFFKINGCGKSYEIIRLQIHSNHGNPRFTCVYRLQVHGKLDEQDTDRLEGQ